MSTGQIPTLPELANRAAIEHVLTMHSRGIDRADASILRSAYWEDATVEYGSFQGSAHAFCERLPQAIRHYTLTQHRIGNVTIEWRGDEARVETYVTAYHLRAAADGDTEMTFIGRYLDRMQRRDDVWKIAHRRVVMDWNRHAAASSVASGPPFDGLARGTNTPEDPLYSFLR
jgi:hypothetical protein